MASAKLLMSFEAVATVATINSQFLYSIIIIKFYFGQSTKKSSKLWIMTMKSPPLHHNNLFRFHVERPPKLTKTPPVPV